MRTLANKVRVQLQLVITSALGTLATLATGISGNSGHTFGRPKAFSIQAKQLRGRGKKPKAKKRKAKHVKLIYTFEAGGLLSGSAKSEGGLGTARGLWGARLVWQQQQKQQQRARAMRQQRRRRLAMDKVRAKTTTGRKSGSGREPASE